MGVVKFSAYIVKCDKQRPRSFINMNAFGQRAYKRHGGRRGEIVTQLCHLLLVAGYYNNVI